MNKAVGVIIICFVLFFSFATPVFYPYSQSEVFYCTKKSNVHFASVAIRSEYEIYQTQTELILSERFSAEIGVHIKQAELNNDEVFAVNEFEICKIMRGMYSVSIDGIVIAVATLYGIDFYDCSIANAVPEKADLYLSADKLSLQVFNEYGTPVGRLNDCIIRRADGEDCFSIEQKDELKNLIESQFGNVPDLYNGEITDEVYCKSLNERISMKIENSNVKIFRYEEKHLIDKYSEPSELHLLGTDANGMDVLARLMYGGRVSIIIGVFSAVLSALLGTLTGCVAGYFGKAADEIIMRLVDINDCIPMLPILVILGSSMELLNVSQSVRCMTIILIFTASGFTGITRVVRGQVLYLKHDISCIAAKSCGVSVIRQIVFRMIPDTMPQIISFTAMSVSNFILAETSISFLGVGVKYPISTWGAMVSENCSMNEIGERLPILISTAFMICITAVGFHALGDAVLDRINSKGKVASKYCPAADKAIECRVNGENILEVENLNIVFHNKTGDEKGASDINFSIQAGSAIAILGKSGGGKSSMADSIMGLLPENAEASGHVYVKTDCGVVDMISCNERSKESVRGRIIGYIMQEPLNCLNPVVRVGKQVEEVIRVKYLKLTKAEIRDKAYRLLVNVGFESDYRRVYSMYPAELSGGMCQRVMIAIATALEPSIVIADEPCSSLDVCSKLAMLKLIKGLMENGTGVVFITHDINEARFLTDNILHIDGNEGYSEAISHSNEALLIENDNAPVKYPSFIKINSIGKAYREFTLSDVSFEIGKGECVGIAGPAGSGKTTVANIIAGIVNADSGTMTVNGKAYDLRSNKNRRCNEIGIQIIFQNPYASLAKNMVCGAQIKEAVRANKIVSKAEEHSYVLEVMKMCGLGEEYYSRYPDSLSGGECQRVCIARTVALKPKLLICDEPLSALDANLHIQIAELLNKLKSEHGISMIYITHELASLGNIADRVIFLGDKDKFIEAYRELMQGGNVGR